MDNLFLLLSIISIFILILGLIKPKLVIRWGDENNKNRKSVLLIYGLAIVIFFVLFAIITPASNDNEIKPQSEDNLISEKLESEDSLSIEELEDIVDKLEKKMKLNQDSQDYKFDVHEYEYDKDRNFINFIISLSTDPLPTQNEVKNTLTSLTEYVANETSDKEFNVRIMLILRFGEDQNVILGTSRFRLDNSLNIPFEEGEGLKVLDNK